VLIKSKKNCIYLIINKKLYSASKIDRSLYILLIKVILWCLNSQQNTIYFVLMFLIDWVDLKSLNINNKKINFN